MKKPRIRWVESVIVLIDVAEMSFEHANISNDRNFSRVERPHTEIEYDDQATEVLHFLDPDIVVDDVSNAFIPTPLNSDREVS